MNSDVHRGILNNGRMWRQYSVPQGKCRLHKIKKDPSAVRKTSLLFPFCLLFGSISFNVIEKLCQESHNNRLVEICGENRKNASIKPRMTLRYQPRTWSFKYVTKSSGRENHNSRDSKPRHCVCLMHNPMDYKNLVEQCHGFSTQKQIINVVLFIFALLWYFEKKYSLTTALWGRKVGNVFSLYVPRYNTVCVYDILYFTVV